MILGTSKNGCQADNQPTTRRTYRHASDLDVKVLIRLQGDNERLHEEIEE